MKTCKIKSVLIANRGEIACRIAKTLRALNYKVYGLASSLDPIPLLKNFVHEVLFLKGNNLQETYLNQEQILALCLKNQIDSIHPAFGFLSENSDFAKLCSDKNVIFIGPDAKTIEIMGSKSASKQALQASGIPLIPGYNGEKQDVKTFEVQSDKIGYPVLLKASFGGGGKGMQIVFDKANLQEAFSKAKNEALNAFGNDHLILEKYIQNPRHIEVQVLADHHGEILHLGERECSLQRRHQKIIEEAPSEFVDEDLRNQMTKTAIQICKTISYKNAGTIEFIVDENKNYYFLEMNTRLQVEHPVTEMVTGLDLVQKQMEIAQGLKLGLSQNEIRTSGHAIEARVYSEDPENQFFPSIGSILHYQEPSFPFLRIDSGICQNSEINLNFDPMIAKVITYGYSREDARKKLIKALENFSILGVKTNQKFLLNLLQHKKFIKNDITTHFIEKHLSDLIVKTDQQDLKDFLKTHSQSLSQKNVSVKTKIKSSNDTSTIWNLKI